MRLLTIHNLAYLQRLMAELRDAIDAGRLAEVAAAVRAGAAPWELARPREWRRAFKAFEAGRLERSAPGTLRRADGARDRVRDRAAARRRAGRPGRAGARRGLRAGLALGRPRPRAARSSPAPTSPRACSPRRGATTRRSSSSTPTREDLPFEDGAFDVALGAFIVNHLPHPERAAAELARVAGRVALAMWAPQDEVAILGLPARAAGDLATTRATGPDERRFTDAAALAALIGGTVHEMRRTLEVETLDALWDGVRGGTVRTAARLAAATPEQQVGVKARLAELAEPYRSATGYDAPDHDPHRRR